MKKFICIMLLCSCVSVGAMFRKKSKLSLSRAMHTKLIELEKSEKLEDENSTDFFNLIKSDSEEDVYINLEDSIAKNNKTQDEEVEVIVVPLEDQPDIINYGTNVYYEEKKNCWSLFKQKLLNFLKKCGVCCSCCCSAFLLGCTKYGENMASVHRYRRMEE